MATSTGSASKNSLEKTTPRNAAGQLAAIEIHRNVSPLGECSRHLAAARAQLHHREVRRLAHRAVELPDARGHQDAEDRLDLLGGEEVAVLAERIARAAVVAVSGW